MSQRAESADTVLAPAGAVIFCRVIDNFGDAGVTWRLSKRLRDLGLPVTLVIDAVDVLARLVHDLDPAATDALVRGIRIADWDAFEAEVSAGDLSRIGGVWPSLVFETFGCRLPDAVEAGLCDGRTRLWVNLDYLSAEEWVEGSHMVWGLHPTLPVKKLWFFPGFTDRTGGLLIEDGLDEARRAFDAAAWRRAHGARDGLRTLFFFVYPVNAIDRLAAGLRAAGEPLNLMLAPGEASDMLERALKGDARFNVVRLPFVPQEEFDARLASGKYTIALAPIRAEGGSVYQMLQQFAGDNNLTGLTDPLYAGTLSESIQRTGSARCQLLRECERQLLEGCTVVPLAAQQKRLLVADGVEGLVFDPFTPVLDLTYTTKN